MRLVFISDTHSLHRYLKKIPDGDVLIHSGDFMNTGRYQDELLSFIDYYSKLPHKYKIVIPGNHDFWAEKYPEDTKKKFKDKNINLLIQKSLTINKIKFYGDPYQPWFCNWAFNLQRGEELRRNWQKIPIDTDVLITHSPPKGILDSIIRTNERVGCEELLYRIKDLNVIINCFGHIHESYGTYFENKTLFINSSVCDHRYNVVNDPVVVDIENLKGEKNVRLV